MKKYLTSLNGKRYAVEEVLTWRQNRLRIHFDKEHRDALIRKIRLGNQKPEVRERKSLKIKLAWANMSDFQRSIWRERYRKTIDNRTEKQRHQIGLHISKVQHSFSVAKKNEIRQRKKATMLQKYGCLSVRPKPEVEQLRRTKIKKFIKSMSKQQMAARTAKNFWTKANNPKFPAEHRLSFKQRAEYWERIAQS